MEFYQQSGEEVLANLNVDINRGLDRKSVDDRRAKYGWNELKTIRRINPLLLFLKQFKNFIIYILLFAVVIAVSSREYTQAIVIMFILLFNAFLGFFQEYRAEKAIEALKKLSGLKAKVLREGAMIFIEIKELVPGDIFMVDEGAKVPADARILEAISLEVSEASLTGESFPVAKNTETMLNKVTLGDQHNMLFSGTIITKGRGKAVVVATGMQSEIGKIAGMITEMEDEPTLLQKKLESFGKKIGLVVLMICLLIFFIGIWKDGLYKILFAGSIIQFVIASKVWLLTAVSLAVAAVPEGLPAIVTIVLAIGVIKMAKKNALIRRLPSVETLGETTVICTDKTGTLTKNEMAVTVAYTNSKHIDIDGELKGLQGRAVSMGKPIGKDDLLIFKIGALCNNASYKIEGGKVHIIGDPTEGALLVSAVKAGIMYERIREEYPRVMEAPFDNIRKMMSTLNRDSNGDSFVFTKGAPESVIEKCSSILMDGKIVPLSPRLKKIILDQNEIYAKNALRVLGFAYKEHQSEIYEGRLLEDNLVFVGLQGMIDPPHSDIKESIDKCKEAGIRVIMITGDHRNTAEAIGRQIGIAGESIEGAEFEELPIVEQLQVLDRVSIFARVEPRHKMMIVSLLQAKGEIVAMTGDGINDAPAIKKADLGISMGIEGTDVTKETSDMILTDDNFTTIVNAVEEGRGLYDNIKKFINYLLSCNLAEVLVIFFAIILGLPLPMTAIMILWLNLITDGFPALALGLDPFASNLMKRPPKKAREGIIDKGIVFNILYISFFITAGVLGLIFWSMQHYETARVQTIAFTAMVIMELSLIRVVRHEHKLGIFSNKYLIWAVAASLLLQVIVIYSPLNNFFGTVALSLIDWALILGVSLIVFLASILGVGIKKRVIKS